MNHAFCIQYCAFSQSYCALFTQYDAFCGRLKTLSEREEERLLYGNVHRNYPENSDDEDDDDAEWRRQQRHAHPDGRLQFIRRSKTQVEQPPSAPQQGTCAVSVN